MALTYQGENKEYIAKNIDDDHFAPEYTRLAMREALNNIKDCFY